MEHCSPLWTGYLTSHLAQLITKETKAFKIHGISHDEAEYMGLSPRVHRQVSAFMKCGHVWVSALVGGMFVYTSWCAVSGVKQCTENKEENT